MEAVADGFRMRGIERICLMMILFFRDKHIILKLCTNYVRFEPYIGDDAMESRQTNCFPCTLFSFSLLLSLTLLVMGVE